MPLRVPLSPLPPDTAPLLTPTGEHARFAPFRLLTPISLVGNREGVHVRLRSRQISGIHAVIVSGPRQTWVRDLGSRTGTFVNGEPVTEAELVPGDALRFGPLTCTFSRTTSGAAKAADAATITLLSNLGGKRIEWNGRVFLIGRKERADLLLPGEDVSEVHALICQIDGRFYVRDAGSRTGTFVNNVGVQQSEICLADVIRVGSTTLKCLGKSGVPAAPPQAVRPQPVDDAAEEEPTTTETPAEWGPLAAAVGRTDMNAPPPQTADDAGQKSGRLSQFWKRLRR